MKCLMPAVLFSAALAVTCAPTAPAAGSFDVLVEPTTPIPAGAYPLEFSFPLPEGAVSDVSQVQVLDRGAPAPADLRVLARWDDGSIKWLRAVVVSTVAGAAPGPQRFLQVRFGDDVEAPAGDPLPVTEDGETVTVSNGVFEVTIGTRGIERLALNGQTLALGDAVRVIDQDGELYDGWAGEPRVTVTRRGAVAVEVEISGASAPPFNFRNRYTIYRDHPVIRRQTYIESAEERDVRMVTVNALQLAPELDSVAILSREPHRLEQPGGAVYWQMTEPQPETWALAEIADGGETQVLHRFVADPSEDPIMGVTGERTGYLIDAFGEDGGIVLCGNVRQWGRDAGLCVAETADGREVAINAHGMWPRHGDELYGRSWRWYEGVAKNFMTSILVHEGPFTDDIAAAAVAAYEGPHVMPDPAWARASGVFGFDADDLAFETQLAPIRRWVELAQVSIAEYEKRDRERFAQRLGGLMSGEIYRGLGSGSGTGGDLNRAVNDTIHWFIEAWRKGDGRLLEAATEIAYAEIDHGMYHVGDPDLVGKTHYHGHWGGLSSGDYGCRSFAGETAYLATGDDYFLDSWRLELDALMRTSRWSSRSGGYTMVNMVWAWERFGDDRYLEKANEIFQFALERQRPDGSATQNLSEGSDLKPWMMGIISQGVLELHRVDPSEEKLGFLRRISDYLVEQQLPDGSWLYIVDEENPWKQGAGTATVAPQLVRMFHLTGDQRYLKAAQRATIWLFNTADPDAEIVRVRHAPGNNVDGNPSHTTCSYIFSLCARISDACRREGLPFVVSARVPLAQAEHWGVTRIDELAPGRIALAMALPAEMGEGTLQLGGFEAGEALAATVGERALSVTADARGMVTLTIPAAEEIAVAVRRD
ncbi:MAG: hypothetical protein ACOX9R_12250 [Armatimonadota bacterium]|jgi:hypothetical protein